MRQGPTNPSKNIVPTNIKEAALINAIEMSGYPLQSVVANKLNQQFGVTEEWGYIDRDSKEHRSLDIFAFKSLIEDQASSVQPSLVLLVECKRSMHPYVFFKNVTERPVPQFPLIAGIPNGHVNISEKNGNRGLFASGSTALGLDKLPFVEPGPPKCASFTKATPKGDKVNLSGSDPFNSLILPLVKALNFASQQYKARQKPERLFPTLILCLSVLDAPMILVESPELASDPILTPWVRIVRQEANPDPLSWTPSHFYVIDAIHIDFFDEVVFKHLLPFAEEFRNRVVQVKDILFQGGIVSNLDDWEWDQIRVKPSSNKKSI